MSEEEKKLSPDSSIRELFEAIRTPEGTNVVPVTLTQSEDSAEMMILISGRAQEAHVIMANLMTAVTNMHEQSEQMKRTQLLDKAGNPIDEQPAIIVPGADG